MALLELAVGLTKFSREANKNSGAGAALPCPAPVRPVFDAMPANAALT
jgi:hypothetical protein